MGNSRFKFRAWCRDKMTLITGFTDHYVFFDAQGLLQTIQDNMTLMQFTGLTDSEKVEIYEGDILLYTEEVEGECICGQNLWYLKVIWENGGWHLLSGCGEVGGLFEEFTGLEVVGTIHENPKLIEVK